MRVLDSGPTVREYVPVGATVTGRVRLEEATGQAWPDDGTDGALGIGEGTRVRIYGDGLHYPYRAHGRLVGMSR